MIFQVDSNFLFHSIVPLHGSIRAEAQQSRSRSVVRAYKVFLISKK